MDFYLGSLLVLGGGIGGSGGSTTGRITLVFVTDRDVDAGALGYGAAGDGDARRI